MSHDLQPRVPTMATDSRNPPLHFQNCPEWSRESPRTRRRTPCGIFGSGEQRTWWKNVTAAFTIRSAGRVLAVSNSPGSFCKDARTYINGRDQLSQIHSPWSDCLEARPHYCYLEGFLSLTVKKNVFANWTQKLLSSLNFIQCSKKIFSRILIFVILGLLKIYVCYFA